MSYFLFLRLIDYIIALDIEKLMVYFYFQRENIYSLLLPFLTKA